MGYKPSQSSPPERESFSPPPAASPAAPDMPPLPGNSWFFLDADKITALFTFNETPVLRAFRHGVMLVMPLLLAAAIALLVNNFPLVAYQEFMASVFGPKWKEPGALLYTCTIDILALATTFTLSDSLLYRHNQQRPQESVMPIMGSLTSFVCLFIMIGPAVSSNGMVLQWAGIRGLFGAIIITFASCSLFLALMRVKRLRLSCYSEGADPILPHLFDSLLPSILTIISFILFREFLIRFGIPNLQQAFYELIRGMFADANNNFGLGALYAFLVQLFWFFGIHGADLLDPITHHVLIKGMELNSIAINNHQVPPYILTKYFFDVYIYLGGSGATLGLLAAIFLRSKDHGTRRIGALSLVPGFFNINELLVFGLPVILNPAFLLPFLFVPLILLVVSYLAVAAGIAPLPVYQVDWITPPFINGLIATDSWRGVALQVVNFILSTLVYLPFVSLADKTKIAGRRQVFGQVVAIAQSGSHSLGGKRLTDRSGSVGALSRSLANDMARALRDNDGSIRLHYQPRVNVVEKSVPYVEALLRWHHPFYGEIPAVLTLAVSQDAGLTKELDANVVSMAFAQQGQWRGAGVFTTVSVNLSESQLLDPNFPSFLDNLFIRYSLPADAILLEVREEFALEPHGRHIAALQAIHAIGANIAVDDFGKGYQTVSQVKRLPLSELQIDSSLVRNITDDANSQDVVGTIQEMCMKMGIKTSVEYVESKEQMETLLELNFSTFQGHFFSQPIPADECAEFISSYTAGVGETVKK